ncbi:hypothetical protein KDN34_12870 [Shewanella yunxiaonensis]|uniref:Uncharacterized protein n=1 Tax=Shewanella yunxiaonensis TaxID=2829809 RepID=A0ABX7YQQ4_9GAMM|nr:hypothetical protein [Shewanella yunxiaonensis]QUN05100.1 hypothetical protein KDN34_12870 [Shewanella yunxiaonensis]
MITLSKRLFSFTMLIICMVLMVRVQAATVEGATYTIISDNGFRDVKRSVDVRLDKKVSAEVLKTIALKLKNSELKKYERTFIAYYLPDMKVGAGAWATTHFDPELEVKILGLTADEEDKMARAAKSSSTDSVGIWMDDRPYAGATITIYRKNKKLYLESKYKDGSSSIEEMAESRTAVGTKLVEKGGNPHGEYFLLDKNGNLQAGGKNGIFLKYKKIK